MVLDDKNELMEKILVDPNVLQYASYELRSDPDVVLLAYAMDKEIIKYATKEGIMACLNFEKEYSKRMKEKYHELTEQLIEFEKVAVKEMEMIQVLMEKLPFYRMLDPKIKNKLAELIECVNEKNSKLK